MKNDKVSKESEDLVASNVDQIKRLFPEVVSEGKIDFERLKAVLGQELDNKEESYSFNWAGRREAFKNIQSTAKGTLVPDENASIRFKETKNLFIEGDNLEVLKLLQKSYFNRIKMIYLDPPYNTGHDFVYKDNFRSGIKAYLEQTGQLGEEGLLTTNPETSGRFHSAWISMMYPRLFLARNIMADDGIIFVSVDDNEVHNLRRIMDEVFGEENFVAQIVWENREGGGGSDSKYFKIKHEYIMTYAKDLSQLVINGIEVESEDSFSFEDKHVKERGRHELIKLNSASIQYSKSLDYPIKAPDGTDILPSYGNKRACWRWSKEKVEWGIKNDFVVIKKDRAGKWAVYTKMYFKVDNEDKPIKRAKRPIGVISKYSSTQANKHMYELFDGKVFDYSKPYELIQYLITLLPETDFIVMDFFAGSGTTAESVLQQNVLDYGKRQFILVQLPEPTAEESDARKRGYKTIADIAKDRINKVITKLKKEEKSKLGIKDKLDLGFKVFKLETSNYKIWENYDGQDVRELTKQLDLFKSPLVNGTKDINLIYECAIKEGLNLNSNIALMDIKGNKIYRVSDDVQSFYICLDDDIKKESMDKLDLKKDDLFICLDNALNDSKKTNISLQCKLKTI